MTTRCRLAATLVRVLAWVLLVVGLSVIALNPFPLSLRYALFWLGVMAIARGIARFAAWLDVAIDLSLLFVCFFGIEIGGSSLYRASSLSRLPTHSVPIWRARHDRHPCSTPVDATAPLPRLRITEPRGRPVGEKHATGHQECLGRLFVRDVSRDGESLPRQSVR